MHPYIGLSALDFLKCTLSFMLPFSVSFDNTNTSSYELSLVRINFIWSSYSKLIFAAFKVNPLFLFNVICTLSLIIKFISFLAESYILLLSNKILLSLLCI
jgi:hypothetical protein